MKRIILLTILLILNTNVYCQFDELLKKTLPDIKEWMPGGAISTSFEDAYTRVPWLDNIDYSNPEKLDLSKKDDGFYYAWLQTYCLKAGAKSPITGAGYLMAPLKGSSAKIIKNVLSRSQIHPEVSQKDIQLLFWAIYAGTNFRDLPADLQARLIPVLTEKEILELNFKVSDAFNLLPGEVKEAAEFYKDLRAKLIDPNIEFSELEKMAVPPDLQGLIPIDTVYNGAWNYIGGGYYARAFSKIYTNSLIELYKPKQTKFEKDNLGRITSFENGGLQFTINYSDNKISNSLDNTVSISSVKVKENGTELFSSESNGWIVKPGYKFSGKPEQISDINLRSNLPTSDEFNRRNVFAVKTLENIKNYLSMANTKHGKGQKNDDFFINVLQLTEALGALIEQNGFSLSDENYNKLLNSISDARYYECSSYAGQTGSKTGGSNSVTAFDFLNGIVMAPANTNRQRLGIGVIESDPNAGIEGTNGQGGRRPRTGGPETNNEGNNDPNSGNNGNNGQPPRRPPENGNYSFIIHQVQRELLPEPGINYNIFIEGANPDPVTIVSIVYTFYDISTEYGTCMNDMRDQIFTSNTPDFEFIPDENPYTELVSSSGNSIVVRDNSGNTLSSGISIKSRDWGGYAKVRAQVTFRTSEGREMTIDAVGEQTGGMTYVNIPFDLNGNHIADKWEEDNHVAGKPADADDETTEGNIHNGDGMTLYEEYRGFIVTMPDLSLGHKRMDPNKKEIFIIDDEHLFGQAWIGFENATDLTAEILDPLNIKGNSRGDNEESVEYKRVNFNLSVGTSSKFAIILKRIHGTIDPYDPTSTHHPASTLGYAERFGPGRLGPPRYNKRVVIFPDRIRNWITVARDTVAALLSRYPGRDVFNFPNSGRQTRIFLERYVSIVSNSILLDELTDFVTIYTTMHELSHACSVVHHNDGSARSEFSGDPNCPMKYVSSINSVGEFLSHLHEGLLRAIETSPPDESHIISYSGWRYCTSPDNCISKFDVNDNVH